MVVTLHRFFDRLFGETDTASPPGGPQQSRRAVPVRRGIPDGYLDKFPPPAERDPERLYSSEPVGQQIVKAPDSRDQ